MTNREDFCSGLVYSAQLAGDRPTARDKNNIFRISVFRGLGVVQERKQSKSSKACCRCEDRFILIETARAVRSRDYRVNQDNLLVGLTGS